MSYRYTLEAALESLQDIEELIRGFPENGEVPSIELDLSLQKLRNIYELLLVLKRPSAEAEAETAAVAIAADEAAEETKAAEEAKAEAVIKAAEEAKAVAVALAASEAAAVAEVKAAAGAMAAAEAKAAEEAKATAEAAAVAATDAASKASEEAMALEARAESAKSGAAMMADTVGQIHGAQILSDRFKGHTTLHETLHQNLGNEAQLHAQGKPVENLMSAIAINDRFTFIRELFNGDSHSFEHAIKALYEAASFNDAYNFMTQNFEWDMNSDAVQLLLDIIRRKYILSRHE